MCILCGMSYRAAVVGASGYTGVELLRLLARASRDRGRARSPPTPTRARRSPTSTRRWPPGYAETVYARTDPAALAGYDVVFLCLPHGQSQQVAGELVDTVGHVVDLGADFRLPRADYERWYGEGHTAPELIGRFAFGMPELYRERDRRRAARRVARVLPDGVVARAGAAARARASWSPPASW